MGERVFNKLSTSQHSADHQFDPSSPMVGDLDRLLSTATRFAVLDRLKGWQSPTPLMDIIKECGIAPASYSKDEMEQVIKEMTDAVISQAEGTSPDDCRRAAKTVCIAHDALRRVMNQRATNPDGARGYNPSEHADFNAVIDSLKPGGKNCKLDLTEAHKALCMICDLGKGVALKNFGDALTKIRAAQMKPEQKQLVVSEFISGLVRGTKDPSSGEFTGMKQGQVKTFMREDGPVANAAMPHTAAPSSPTSTPRSQTPWVS